MSCDVLVVAAFHPELAPLQPLLGAGLRARVGSLDVAARMVGIGVAMAATGTAMEIAEVQPRLVVAVGTCGAYAGAQLAIGDVAVPSRIVLAEASVTDGLAEFPAPMSLTTQTHIATVQALIEVGGKPADVAATVAITVDDRAAARLSAATGAAAEHLEAHGMATACAARGVPFAACLGVANVVGSRARQEWMTHHRAAASAAIAVVRRWLQASAGLLR